MSRANEPAGGRQREGVSTGRQRLWAEDGVNEEDGAKVLANAPEPDETAEVRGFYDGDSDDGYAGVRDDMISQDERAPTEVNESGKGNSRPGILSSGKPPLPKGKYTSNSNPFEAVKAHQSRTTQVSRCGAECKESLDSWGSVSGQICDGHLRLLPAGLRQEDDEHTWTAGLFSCCSIPGDKQSYQMRCFPHFFPKALVCPWLALGSNATMLQEEEPIGPSCLHIGKRGAAVASVSFCCPLVLVPCCGVAVLAAFQRRQIMRKYNIDGHDVCTKWCLVPWFCAPCALHQHGVFLAEQRYWHASGVKDKAAAGSVAAPQQERQMSRAKLLEGNSASREIDQTASEGQELVDNEQVGIDLYDDSDEDGDSPNSAYSEPNETCSTGDIGGGQAPLGMQFRDGILDEEHMARPEPDEAGKRKSSCPQGGSVQTPAQGDELPEYSATEEFGESGTGSASSSVWDGILDNNDRALPSRPQALGVEHKAVGYVAAAGAVVVPLVHSPRKATGSDWKSEEEEYNGKAPARSFWEGILEEADKPQSVTAAMRDEIEGHHAQHQVAMVDLCVDTVRISQHGRRTTSEVSAGDYRSPSPSPPPSPPPKRSMSLRAKYVRGSTESSLQNQTAEVPLRERIGSRRGSSSGASSVEISAKPLSGCLKPLGENSGTPKDMEGCWQGEKSLETVDKTANPGPSAGRPGLKTVEDAWAEKQSTRPTALQPFDEGRNPRQRGFMVTKNPLAIQVPEPRNPPRDILSAGHGSTGTVAFSLPRTNLRSPSTSPPSDSKWASVPQLHSQRREAFSSVSPKEAGHSTNVIHTGNVVAGSDSDWDSSDNDDTDTTV